MPNESFSKIPTVPLEAFMTRRGARNLLQLAEYVYTKTPQSQFTMRSFRRYRDCAGGLRTSVVEEAVEPPYMSPDCKSVGCFLGHGPEAGVQPQPGDTWMSYINRNFAVMLPSDSSTLQLDTNRPLWLWVADEDWAYFDNTPAGAAMRALWAILHGVPIAFTSKDSIGPEIFVADQDNLDDSHRNVAGLPLLKNWIPTDEDWAEARRRVDNFTGLPENTNVQDQTAPGEPTGPAPEVRDQ